MVVAPGPDNRKDRLPVRILVGFLHACMRLVRPSRGLHAAPRHLVMDEAPTRREAQRAERVDRSRLDVAVPADIAATAGTGVA
ncbi:hypothetical protein GCM10023405_15560 [Streptomonospora salina]